MSDTPPNPANLDRAYGDGMLAGFLGLETPADCPFGRDRIGARIAWLDGFADGVRRGASSIGAAGPVEDAPHGDGAAGSGQACVAVTNIAMAHLLRLTKCAGRREKKPGELASALQAAAKFIHLVGLSGTGT